MANTSEEIKVQQDELGRAKTIKAQSEDLSIWLGRLTDGTATITTIQILGPTPEFIILDVPNHDIHNKSKASVIQIVQQKIIELDQEVQTILVAVDAEIP